VETSVIGTDLNAAKSIPNGGGILINSDSNTIGPCLVVSGNTGYGVLIATGGDNVIELDCIGDDGSGFFSVPNEDGIGIMSSNNAVMGNIISGNTNAGVIIGATGTGNTIERNYIGVDIDSGPLGNGVGVDIEGSDNIVQNGNLISGNMREGIAIGGNGNLVRLNPIGMDITQAKAVPNGTGIRITGSNNTIGGAGSGIDSNIISGNSDSGVAISGDGNVVSGNYIGVDVTTVKALGNQDGIFVTGNINLLLGNLVSGNARDGILIQNGGGNLLQGNLVGTDGTQTVALGNGRHGINLDFAPNNQIGGDNDKVSNVIAFNGIDGILVRGGTGNTLQRNIIFSHTAGLGIELREGGNNDQAAPAISAAFPSGDGTDIEGTLTSTPNTIFTLEFFSNQVCNPSGFGEAQSFVDTLRVTTDGTGVAVIAAVLRQYVSPGQFLTGTATDSNGNTSAFSQCIQVGSGGSPSRRVSVPERQGPEVALWLLARKETAGASDMLIREWATNFAVAVPVHDWVFAEFGRSSKWDSRAEALNPVAVGNWKRGERTAGDILDHATTVGSDIGNDFAIAGHLSR